MKSKITKILCLVMGAILLVTGSVAVTLAYLQDLTQTVTNTMTAGKVDIKLDEAKVNAKGVAPDKTDRTEDGNTYKLIPGSTYDKDPVVTVLKGSESSWVFFGIAIDTKVSAVLDSSKNVIASQLSTNKWKELKNADNSAVFYTDTDNTKYKIYYYETKVDASAADKPLTTFTKFSVSTTADVSKADKATIKVKAFAVQSENLSTPLAAWDGAFKPVAG